MLVDRCHKLRVAIALTLSLVKRKLNRQSEQYLNTLLSWNNLPNILLSVDGTVVVVIHNSTFAEETKQAKLLYSTHFTTLRSEMVKNLQVHTAV